jgi:hypothetical protein
MAAEAIEARNAELEKEKRHLFNLLTEARAEINILKANYPKTKFKVVKEYENKSDDQSLPEIDF